MAVNAIPEKLVNFNVYDQAERLIGLAGEVTLPTMESLTESIRGAGIAGEYESVTPGHFGSMEIEIPFRILHDHTFRPIQNGMVTYTLRGSQQFNDISAGELVHRALKIIVRGQGKGVNLGKLGVGMPVESSGKLELQYIKVDEDGKELLEYDKLNFICRVNGQDLLADVRAQI